MDPVTVVVGFLALVLGVIGAGVTQRRLERSGRGRWVPLLLVPHGVLVGGGAALVRGWAVALSMTVGAVAIPIAAILGRAWEVRRSGHGGRSGESPR